MASEADILAYSDDTEPVLYEVGYHLLPTVPEERILEEAVGIKDAIDSHGGMFVSEGVPKLIRLAYQMPKVVANKRKLFDSAFFGWIRFRTAPHEVRALHDDMKRNEHVLRFIIVKATEEKPIPLKKMTFLSGKRTEGAAHEKGREEPAREKLSEEELEKTIEGLVV